MRALRALAAVLIASVGLFQLYEAIEAPASQVFGPTIVHGRGHAVALTFDDGPNIRTTPRVLTLLERNHIRATFFVVGRAVDRNPELIHRMVRDGDEIGNHTQTHAHLNFLLTRRAIDREIDLAQTTIAKASGSSPRYLRPPFGARDFATIDAARRRGLQVVMWTAMLGDEPARSSPRELAEALLAQVHDGAIIIIHDGDQGRSGSGGRTYESAAVGIVIARLRADGYRFLTISQMRATQA
jgi:peptidoglycan/xylan/chitin deacetylase (PgdA/CDA1 family)